MTEIVYIIKILITFNKGIEFCLARKNSNNRVLKYRKLLRFRRAYIKY